MKIDKPWNFDDNQTITIQSRQYNVYAAILLAESLPVKSLLIEDLYISYNAPCEDNFRDFIAHIKLVNDADLKYPILLNENGSVLDGKHRLAKAILLGKKTIKARRFIKDPDSSWEHAN